MRTVKHLAVGVLLLSLLLVAIDVGISALKESPVENLLDSNFSLSEVILLCSLLGAAAVVLLLVENFLVLFNKSSHFRFLRPSILWLVTGTVVSSPTIGATPPSTPAQSVPVISMLSPAMCVALVQRIIRIRRMQVLEMKVPQRMSEEHLKTLEMIARSADTTSLNCDTSDLGEVPTDVQEVLEAIGMTTEDTPDLLFRLGNSEPQIIVHLFGYPLVRNKEGITAEFRKNRALELLTWLSLNRDRARRSAARTAMWEIAINDSTFSTVVSEMRRGLSVLGSSAARDSLVPITYNDDIPLSATVISDADILADVLHRFQQDESYVDDLLNCLQWLRDVPFAGTSYSWADLDGSTTRLVILGVTAATEVARWALRHQNADALTSAVRAGLRVMPGNEELLELQRSGLMMRSNKFQSTQ
jgi:hypothetical protein